MGTSQSSRGSPAGVPLVPPWVPDVQPLPDDDESAPNEAGPIPATPPLEVPPRPVPVAPRGRFGPSRTSLGDYARTGDAGSLRSALGHYVRKGLGGSSTAARRFGGTAQTAGALFGALTAAASGAPGQAGSPLDPALLAGRSAGEIMDAVVEAVRPVDGTQDAEAARLAIRNALSDLLARFPDADLLGLSEEQRLFAIERYAALDVYNRFFLDLGKALQDKAPSVAAALSRLREIKNYIGQAVSAAFRRARATGKTLNAARLADMVRTSLQDAFTVFEGYVT